MSIEELALEFAIKAHNGQIRKGEPDKPEFFHVLDVGNILKENGFDENVVAAGYLHDVVEDTKYTLEEVKKEFGDDIASLVEGASEPDKSLTWEERKKHTIENIKKLDLRHKAIVCADKISNLEDLYYVFGKTGVKDFSNFNRGYDKQKWYYTSIFESIIENEEMIPMFERYKELLIKVFDNDEDEYLKNIIFNDDQERYEELKKLHFKKKEVYKLNKLIGDNKPYVIEFTGTPRTGKTTLINDLEDFFKKGGFKVSVLEEFTTSKKYKNEIFPLMKNESKKFINKEIPKYVFEYLKEEIIKKPDIIIVDRCLLDRLIWEDRLFLKDGISIDEYNEFKNEYIPLIKSYINIIIGTFVDSLTSVKRDYKAHLALEKRNFLNEQNVDEYNKSFLNIFELSQNENIDFHKIDSKNEKEKTQSEMAIEISNIILDDMRNEFINKLIKKYVNVNGS